MWIWTWQGPDKGTLAQPNLDVDVDVDVVLTKGP